MIASIHLDLAFHRRRLSGAAQPLVAGIHAVAGTVNGRSQGLRRPGSATLLATVHVVAEAPL